MEKNNSCLLLAGWLADGTGERIQKGVLVDVQGGRIERISKVGHGKRGAEVSMDFSHCTLLPALIDSHVHLCMSGNADPCTRQRQLERSFREAKEVIIKHLMAHLACGVGAVRDAGDYGGHALRYKNECLPQAGPTPALRAAGRAWHARGRYGSLVGRSPLKGLGLARSVGKVQVGADHVKIVNSGINSLKKFGEPTLPQFQADELKAAVEVAKRLGLKTMVHANGEKAVRQSIEAGCHSIEHGFFMGWDNLRRMADAGVIWVPTAFTMKAYSRTLPAGSREADMARRYFDHQIEQIVHGREYGVSIALGTDAGSLGVHHGQALWEEIRILQLAGYSIEVALRCATLNGARLLDLEREMGTLTPEMPATFLAVRGGPDKLPDSLARPELVVVAGRACEGLWEAGFAVGN